MLCTRSVCLHQMARGDWAANMAFWRFVNNPQVTTDKLIEGWSLQTSIAVRVMCCQSKIPARLSSTPVRDIGAAWAKSAKAMLAACCCMP